MRVSLGCLAMLVLGGCSVSYANAARVEHAQASYCPIASVIARERPDLHAYDVASSLRIPEPDPAVLADPVRRGLFEERRAQWNRDMDGSEHVVVVEGCGHRVLYTCHTFHSTYCHLQGEATDSTSPMPPLPG